MKLSNKLSLLLIVSLLSTTQLLSNDKSISLKYPIKDLPMGNVSSNPQNQGGGGYSNSTQNNNNSREINVYEETYKNNFEMNADEAIFQNTINSRDKFNKLLSETLNIDYMMTPEVRPFKTTDTIFVHPHHITTIVLPVDIELKVAKASFPTDVFDLNENSILIKPGREFHTGNIVVTATNKNENFIFNILIKKIETSFVHFDSDYNKYLIEDNYLSLIYQYERKNLDDKFNVLQNYLKTNNIKSDDLSRIFTNEGDYDMLMFKGVTYYIIKDSRFGNINYGDVDFRVDTKYTFAESSNKIQGLRR
ncbi:hypothetical protein [Aliarcobacter butzleri]|uniref:hypothetical protein n=1 Tax=Aliarcobacter butzleri TaxID=28197 RepID=UPI001269C336|nr:hypothetical protein [Aliarcobacter butzleri]